MNSDHSYLIGARPSPPSIIPVDSSSMSCPPVPALSRPKNNVPTRFSYSKMIRSRNGGTFLTSCQFIPHPRKQRTVSFCRNKTSCFHSTGLIPLSCRNLFVVSRFKATFYPRNDIVMTPSSDARCDVNRLRKRGIDFCQSPNCRYAEIASGSDLIDVAHERAEQPTVSFHSFSHCVFSYAELGPSVYRPMLSLLPGGTKERGPQRLLGYFSLASLSWLTKSHFWDSSNFPQFVMRQSLFSREC